MSGTNGNLITTFTGRTINVFEPRPDDICIEDIAHALAHQCRYGGHTRRFYSVAEHCCILAGVAPPYLKLIALMHDAAEAYLVDVPRPIKKQLLVYYDIEAVLEQAIAKRFGLVHPWHHAVMALDDRILEDEKQLRAAPAEGFGYSFQALDVTIESLEPAIAERRFLDTFERLTR